MTRRQTTTSGTRIAAGALALALLLGLGTALPAAAARPAAEDEAARPSWAAPWTQLGELFGRLLGIGEAPGRHAAPSESDAAGGMDPDGFGAGGDHGPDMDPNGLEAGGDHGPGMDPNGFGDEGDDGPGMDPNG